VRRGAAGDGRLQLSQRAFGLEPRLLLLAKIALELKGSHLDFVGPGLDGDEFLLQLPHGRLDNEVFAHTAIEELGVVGELEERVLFPAQNAKLRHVDLYDLAAALGRLIRVL
jgi:hypothetical protein